MTYILRLFHTVDIGKFDSLALFRFEDGGFGTTLQQASTLADHAEDGEEDEYPEERDYDGSGDPPETGSRRSRCKLDVNR
jgi:hypothetical protein